MSGQGAELLPCIFSLAKPRGCAWCCRAWPRLANPEQSPNSILKMWGGELGWGDLAGGGGWLGCNGDGTGISLGMPLGCYGDAIGMSLDSI